MQRLLTILLLLAAAVAPSAADVPAPPRGDVLRVVATVPDLADVVARVGGDRVEVESIARGTENVHAVRARPSTIVALNRADVFVQMGLALEHAYVPGLLEVARNADVLPGAPGFVDCSEGWTAIEVPERIDRSDGPDVHPMGNPHYNLDPRGGRQMAERVLAGLVRVDPSGAAAYREGFEAYARELEEARRRWDEHEPLFRGRKIVTYHSEFSYLADYHGLEVVAVLEPKPGVAPTPKHLAEVVRTMQREEVPVILTAAWSNSRLVEETARKAGARVLELPVMVGGDPGAESWIALMDLLHRRLAEGLGVEPPR